ncbi:MAG: tRNA (5-methylaminomethyl-2-thiouridine)(34)-methyltransferase MnmD [Schleiferiaceae bacterium]
MKREVRETKDGSKTLYIEALDEHYHSFHGALQESLHVFIKYGLHDSTAQPLRILEVGLGTGLNALLTCVESIVNYKGEREISYVSLEAYPLIEEEWKATEYEGISDLAEGATLYEEIHTSPWEQPVELTPGFTLTKHKTKLQDFETSQRFDLIYYDAFAPSAQPELWTEEVFEKLYAMTAPGGFLVTYCAKGQVKRNMKAAGFTVEALPGPPGKREMTRATKPE